MRTVVCWSPIEHGDPYRDRLGDVHNHKRLYFDFLMKSVNVSKDL